MSSNPKPSKIPWHLILVFLLLAIGIGVSGYFYYKNQKTLSLLMIVGSGVILGLLWYRQRAQIYKRQYEAELEHQALVQRFDYLTKYANDIFLLMDQDLNIVEANDRALSSYGYTHDELLQLNLRELRPSDLRSLIDEQAKQLEQSNGMVFETIHQRKDGTTFPVEVSCRLIEVEGKKFSQGIIRDITERRRAEEALQVSYRFLQITYSHDEIPRLLKEFAKEIKDYTGCAAVGIRILDEEGNIPYQTYKGFSQSFFELESPLSIKSDRCMCINVIKGDIDPKLPFYTEGGSFYMNGTTRFLATVSEQEKGETRNVCNQVGYESVALVPIRRMDRIFGLIHVADPREDRVPLRMVQVLEREGMQLGTTILRRRAEETLRESKERYRSLFENMLNGLAYCRMLFDQNRPQDFIYLDVNSAFETLTGLKNVIGKKVSEVIPGIRESDPELLEIYGRVALTGRPERFETYVKALEMWFSISVYSPGNEHFVAVFDVITERKRAEGALRESEDRYRDLVENSQDLICTHDLQGQFLSVNPAVAQLLGYDRSTILNMNVRDILAPRARDQFSSYLETIRKDGAAKGSMFIQTATGERRILEYNNTLRTEGVASPIVRSINRDITERKRAEEALQESEERYRTLVETSPDAITLFDLNFNIIMANRPALTLYGYENEEEVIGRNVLGYLAPDQQTRAIEDIGKVLETGSIGTAEYTLLKQDATSFPAELKASLILDKQKKPVAILCVSRDITERKRAEEEKRNLEEQLRQSQKMEAVGQLAGGIAHDFNNLLTVIKGYSQLSIDDLKEDDPLKGNIEEIRKAADRAADLTRQLLAFSRRQVLEMKVLDLNTILKNLDKMLRRIIGEDIELTTILAEGLGRVKTDPGQIEQVILNLAVNARDAMPRGGKLAIETANAELDDEYARNHVTVTPGRYVVFSVSDTGVGMMPEVRERVFEPFFTTKERGKGTGLGLSTVYGIVKQSGGNIWVYSEPGKGTTFKIYLPRVDEPLEELRERMVKAEFPRGSETILVVEDEDEVQKLAVRILEKQGYRVLKSKHGNEALTIFEERKEPIHLILTDVVMPQMSGKQLIEKCRRIRRDFGVLYMSGYTDNAIAHHGILDEGIDFIQKPFTVEGLARKVREVLDKKS